jgi:hypothetical protein
MTLLSKLQRWLSLPGLEQPAVPIPPPSLEEEEVFIAELYRLGLHHLRRYRRISLSTVEPGALLIGLSRSSEARVRGALIPLLLMRPDYGQFLTDAVSCLRQTNYAQPEFEAPLCWVPALYGQAAAYLQVREAKRLRTYPLVSQHWMDLPDSLPGEMNVPNIQSVRDGKVEVEAALSCLEQVHVKLAGLRGFHATLGYDQNVPHLYHSLDHPWATQPDGLR